MEETLTLSMAGDPRTIEDALIGKIDQYFLFGTQDIEYLSVYIERTTYLLLSPTLIKSIPVNQNF